MKKLIIILFLISPSLFYSCEKVKDQDTTIQIFKFKTSKDYSNNVPVELSEDKNKITSSPSNPDNKWPLSLSSGYYMNGSMGVNSGYLSLTIEEFNSYDINPSLDSLYNWLVEKDPYLEYYYRNDDDGAFRNENGAYGLDTAFINEIIISNQLEDYFIRLK